MKRHPSKPNLPQLFSDLYKIKRTRGHSSRIEFLVPASSLPTLRKLFPTGKVVT